MGLLFEKSLDGCEEKIAAMGKTPQEITSSLLEADEALLRSLYTCMERDFILANKTEVSLPQFGTKRALALLAVYIAYKNDAGSFPKNLLDQINGGDSQHLRHMRREKGIRVAKSSRGEYYLENLAISTPFTNRHRGIRASSFEEIKRAYGYRCATCGAQEGQLHHLPQYRESGEKVILHKGHMNPHRGLDNENVIPQCQFCNRAYRDWVVFDKNGRVVGVSSWGFVLKSIERGYLRMTEENRDLIRKLIDLLTNSW